MLHTHTHKHTFTYRNKQKWDYLVKQFMLYLFRSHHSKAQQHRISFLNYVFQLQNKSSELKDAIWQFLANHGASKSSTHNNAFLDICHILAMSILRQHIPGTGSHAIRKNLATERSNDSLCISEALLKKQTNTLLF